MVGDSVCEWHTTSSPSLFSSDLSFPRLRVVKEGEKKRGGGGGGGRGEMSRLNMDTRKKREEEKKKERGGGGGEGGGGGGEGICIHTGDTYSRVGGEGNLEIHLAASFLYFFSRFFFFDHFLNEFEFPTFVNVRHR